MTDPLRRGRTWDKIRAALLKFNLYLLAVNIIRFIRQEAHWQFRQQALTRTDFTIFMETGTICPPGELLKELQKLING